MGVMHRRRRAAMFSYAVLLAVLLLLASVSSSAGGGRGPGSWPPACRWKCGGCAPCRAVHVPIQPGVSKPMEYYPEAWRCKCGNTLFMP